VNKPDKIVVEKFINRRWAILWHLSLSAIGVFLSFYIGWKVNNILIGFANLLCVALLWFYSTTFKRKLLIGNVMISLLSAWVVLVLYVSEWNRYFNSTSDEHPYVLTRVFRFAFLYAGFAFIISLIREVVKDIEDMPGDAKYGCRTMPIVWGVHVAKIFVSTWLFVLIAALGIAQFYVLQFRWWWSALYCFLMILIPLLYVSRKLFFARTGEDFHELSSLIKLVMLTGILSMLFFRIYS
jgi:4-hydroxybenzoate polyprenyltransferase